MELLSAYLDEELNETQSSDISAFLTQSPEARRALEELRFTKSLFASTPRVHAPNDLLDFIENKAAQTMERAAKPSFWTWANPWAWTSMTATASAAAIALLIGLHSPHQIPYEVLLAAHANAQGGVGLHQTLVSSAHSSTLYSLNQNAKA